VGIAQDLILRVASPTGNPVVGNNLPAVTDPGATLAGISRSQYDDYVSNFGQFESDLINKSQTDTSIIDQARADAPKAGMLSKEINRRNVSRYGASLDPATARELERTEGRKTALGTAQAINDAQIDQDTANTSLASRLIDIGQGVQSGASQGLATAAANRSALDQAYRGARTASRNSTLGTLAGLGSAAMMAMAF
jgi:hypothetical protein